MHILYASKRPPYPFFLGGAARCAYMLLHGMSQETGVSCAAVGDSAYSDSPWGFPDSSEYESLGIKSVSAQSEPFGGEIDCGYPVHLIPHFEQRFSEFVDEFKPDVVWAQQEGAENILGITARKGIQGLFYVHDAEFDSEELKHISDLGCHIVCSSAFLAGKVQRVIGRAAHVVYPASELYFGASGDPQGHITMINPHRVKGLDTFLTIAEQLPEQKFLLLESWRLDDSALGELQEKLAALSNIEFRRRVSDMREIYAKTKLLLVPSVWEEGFGMVAIEAQSCRIPVIASARGGLPESVGDGGALISDYRNVDAWVREIKGILGDDSKYAELADRAYRHASSHDFSPPHLARRFFQVCSAEPVSMSVLSRALYGIRKNRFIGRFIWKG
jgi:hypothetical protein